MNKFLHYCLNTQLSDENYAYIILTDVNFRLPATISSLFLVEKPQNRIRLYRTIGARSFEKFRSLPSFGQVEEDLYTGLLSPEVVSKSDDVSEALQKRIGEWYTPIMQDGKLAPSVLAEVYAEASQEQTEGIKPYFRKPSDYKSEHDLMLNRIFGGRDDEKQYSERRQDVFFSLPHSDNNLFAIIGSTNLYDERPFRENAFENLGVASLVFAGLFQKKKLVENSEQEKHQIRELEERLREEERRTALHDFMVSVCHELRNPAAVIGGFAQRISDKAWSRKIKEYSKIIVDANSRLEKACNQIQEYAQPPPVQEDYWDPLTIVAPIARKYKSAVTEETLRYAKEGHSELPKVIGDGQKLTEALENLILGLRSLNANSGKISIRTTAGQDFVHNGLKIPRYVEISTSVEGVEYSPYHMTKMLEPMNGGKNSNGNNFLSRARHLTELNKGYLDHSEDNGVLRLRMIVPSI
jgi:nitrogen-specific signal transduction histidine kinase